MTLGTRSLLFGAHQFILHPLFLARAWWLLYGFPWKIQLWVAFFVHDIGYFGCQTMDGDDGARHPETGAAVMNALFGQEWSDFTLLHSRRYAAMKCRSISNLCYADKLAFLLTPRCLYLPFVILTGEVWEYMEEMGHSGSPRAWYDALRRHYRVWFRKHLTSEEAYARIVSRIQA